MNKIGHFVVKHRKLILLVAVILLIPSVIGMAFTRINYDMLDYLPGDIDTMKGQEILLEDFDKGAFSILVVEGMETKDIAALKSEIEDVDHVVSVIWYDSILDSSIPMEILPSKYYDAFNKGDSTLMAVFFDTSTSADETMEAIGSIRALAGKKCFVTGMSAMVTDLRNLCEKEEAIYVAIAVLCSVVVMMLFMDSFIIPFVFLASIGMAILLNMGTNIFKGEISFITQALAAVLQLAVTMDYSIFLWHSYSEQKRNFPDSKEEAMGNAVSATISSVVGSSITTVAGFIALCFMTFTLGLDLGIVMAKGVILGVIGCVTTLPAMILMLDKLIEKTRHKPLMPQLDKLSDGIVKAFPVFIIHFLLIIGPAFYGNNNTKVYYDLGATLPEDMEYVIATNKLQDEFDMSSTHMILADANLPAKDARAMVEEIEKVDGVKFAMGLDSLIGSSIPEEILPDSVRSILKSDRYQLMLVSSEYKVATDEVNAQVEEINNIIKKYDDTAMLIGEAPCTKDLITITDHDFQVVDAISIVAIFVIIAIVLKSATLPFILVAVIEFSIFINLGIPFYTGTELPFIAPICISTIQLGATVDYAILMTNRYKQERIGGLDKKGAVTAALNASMSSIIVSALGFFASTFGVALYSDVDMISSLCMLMARGALISMCSVLLVLPSMFMVFDKLICRTTAGMKQVIVHEKEQKAEKSGSKITAARSAN